MHNGHVVRDLSDRGAVFVDSELDVPARRRRGALRPRRRARRLQQLQRRAACAVIDATCPLVTKVHTEARRFAADGYTIVLIGHEGHDEVVGTMGEAPASIQLIGSVAEIDGLEIADPERVAYLTQTTLSVDETVEIIGALRERYPAIVGPKKDDICYATQNRQNAVKQLAREVDLVLVIGSRNSSNSNRLVDVDARDGRRVVPDRRRDRHRRRAGSRACETVGVTSGASAPEWLVERVVSYFRSLGVENVESHELVDENVHFSLPVELRRASSVSP